MEGGGAGEGKLGAVGREGGDSRKEGRPLDISMLKAVTQTYMLNFISELLLTSFHSCAWTGVLNKILNTLE